MPIVQLKPTSPVTEQPTLPKIHSPEIQSNVVDTKYNPLSSLLTYVEGSFWAVDYYSQVIDKDNALAGQDVGQSGVYQQYKVIRGFELKVANSLNWIQDSNSKSFSVTGSAHIHSLVIPNHGDMFTADVGDGREGVFQITLSDKKSLLKDSTYFIEYQLIYFTDASPEKKADLESKVVQEVHYSRDFLMHGQDPLLITSDYNATNELKLKYHEMIDHYFRWFFSKEFSTLLVPGQSYPTYDHFVVSYMASILNTDDNFNIRFMRKLNVDDDYYLKEPQLYAAMLNKDILSLKTGNNKMGLVSAKSFSANTYTEGIRFVGIDNVVYPVLPQTVYDAQHSRVIKPLLQTTLRSVDTRGGNLNEIIYDAVLTMDGVPTKALQSVLVDDYYVLSEKFYEDFNGKTLLEILLLNYFENKPNKPIDILKLAEGFINWGGLERFYYIPILLTLIKNCIRGL